MDWSSSYRSEWRVYRVNQDTWADGDEVAGADSVSVTRTADGALLESGSMDVSGGFDGGYCRIVMIAEQEDVERVEVATLLFERTGGERNRGGSTCQAQGRSVLAPASTTVLAAGSYAPKGCDGAEYAAGLLRSAINAPVEASGSFTLDDHVVHEPGCTVLDAAWAVLSAGEFVIQVDGHGTVHVLPRPTEPALALGAESGMVVPGIKYTADASKVPNRYIAVSEAVRAEAVNDLASSPVSTVSRGHYVDQYDDAPVPVNGETLESYARRRLAELSTVSETRSYTREFAPGATVYDLVDSAMDGMEGRFRITSQTLNCGYGITVAEQVAKEVNLWQ